MRKLITVLSLKVVKCDCGASIVKDRKQTIYKCPHCSSIYNEEGKVLYKRKKDALVNN